MRCACDLSACIAVAVMPARSRCTHDAVGAMLRSREDQHRVHSGLRSSSTSSALFFSRGTGYTACVTVLAADERAPDLHDDRLAQILARERLDFRRHRRAEQQRLAVARESRRRCG